MTFARTFRCCHGGEMINIPEAGFHWRAEADGSILYRVNEHTPTYVITRTELSRITHAAELVAAALFASIVFTFAFNGHWWLSGFRTPEFAVLLLSIIVIPALFIGNLARVRHAILSQAQRAAQDIEIYALTETISLATRYLTRNIASFWLWFANVVLLFVACEIAIATVRFLRTPASEYMGSHRPGPLDGVF
ncbi:MAG: hypothetical protein EOO78_11160, partial [Oxalobacteraceae bacterium]